MPTLLKYSHHKRDNFENDLYGIEDFRFNKIYKTEFIWLNRMQQTLAQHVKNKEFLFNFLLWLRESFV